MWDYHAFGTYIAVAPGRLVSRFAWVYPQHTPGYAVHLAAGLPREQYDGLRYEPPTHTLSLVWYGLDAETLRAAVNEAMQAITPGTEWTFQAAGSSLSVTTKVLDVSASEPYECDVNGRPGTEVTYKITTRPGWRASEVTITPAGAATLPHVYSIPDVAGSMPCPVRVTHTHDQATLKQAFGVRHSPSATAGYVQDYQGNIDGDALSGQATTGVMDADGTPLGVPASLDTNLYRGWYMAACRVEQPDATPSDTTYFATVTTSGSGLAQSSSFVTAPVHANLTNAFETVYLGPLPIPAGPVPSLDAGSGYGAETLVAQQAAWNSSLYIGSDGMYDAIGQTVHLAGGHRVRSFEFLLDESNINHGFKLEIYSASGGMPSGSLLLSHSYPDAFVPGSNVRIWFAFDVPVTGDYAFVVTILDPSESATVRSNSAGGYADGNSFRRRTLGGYWVADERDMKFALYAQVPLGFATTVAISAANAGGGTAKIDTVALIPYDEWSVISALSCAAAQGIMLDAEDEEEPTAYVCKADGSIGPVSQTLIDYQGTPVLWPGDSAIVVAAQTPDDPPTGSDL
ncbi:MAG: hypothetical protein LLG24_01195, partial [Actinomycetia bacterium]|nr:hypothetical protein [Actinomycetes bacterium]